MRCTKNKRKYKRRTRNRDAGSIVTGVKTGVDREVVCYQQI